jgi:hypothetical protein
MRRWPTYEHQLCQIPQYYRLKNSIWKSLQILSSLLVSQRFIMNKTVPVTPRDLLTTWPILIRHYISIVCVISSICNFVQIIPDSGCVQKPFNRSLSALNLAESNNALFETALLLFPPMACHSEYPVLSSHQDYTRSISSDTSKTKLF